MSKYIEKFREIHGDTYDYSLVEYNGARNKIKIICKEHGVFEQTPDNHKRKRGCPECGKKKSRPRVSQDEILARFNEVHGDTYDYSLVEYTKSSCAVKIICKEHGVFEQTPDGHVTGRGCPECGKKKSRPRVSQDEILARFNEVHGDTYDYSLVEYCGMQSNIKIICKEHGTFEQTPVNHLAGKGCPLCGRLKTKILDFDEILARFNEVHGDTYDYSLVEYSGMHDNVKIICKIHGVFEQTPANHLAGKKCRECGWGQISDVKTLDDYHFIKKAKLVHGKRYDYSQVEYKSCNQPVKIICETHGVFEQTPDSHYAGHGCRKCVSGTSNMEMDVAQFIKDFGFDVVENSRKIIPPFEIDIYIPQLNLAIEFCGLFWHSEIGGKKSKHYHRQKYEMCKSRGIRLITIFEDEWVEKKSIVKSVVGNMLGQTKTTIYGRQISLLEIDYTTASDFLEANHLQGKTKGKIYIGGYYNNKLVSVMVFGVPTRQSKYEYELKRFATELGILGVGFASKLLAYFKKTYNPESIVSFSDNRWFDGGVYKKLGFICDEDIRPDYSYVKRSLRYHKSKFRKSRLAILFDDTAGKTEWEIMQMNGYDRIWDCGKMRWVL